MNPGHLLSVYQVEVERLFLRGTAIIGLAFAAIFGILGPILVALGNYSVGPQVDTAGMNGAAVDAMAGPALAGWDWAVAFAFSGRNLLFLPVLIFLLGGLSMASEFKARTTREDVLRPLARWQLLGAKWGALLTWILAANALTLMLSAGLGLIVAGGFTFDETFIAGVEEMSSYDGFVAYAQYAWSPVGNVIMQVATTFVMDLGFATLALCIAVLTRSVAATVASLVMVFVVQLFAAIGLGIVTAEQFQMLVKQAQWLPEDTATMLFEWAGFIYQWQPPFVLGCVSYGQPWEGYVTLSVITIISLIVAVARFETMDVP